MKKKTRKIVGFLLSSVMMLSCLPVSNAATGFNGFTDNFDGYAVTDNIYGWQSTATDGVWTLSDIWPGDAYDNHYGGSQVTIESGTDNNLTLIGFGAAETHKVAFNLAKEKYAGIGNNVKMNVSMRKTGNSDGGVRFLVSEDEQSYYEFKSGWSGGWWQSINKVKGGVSEQIASLNMLIDANQWVDVEFYNVDDTIYWTVTNTATGVSNSGSYTDPDGLPAKGGNAKYQLWTLNGGGTEQFDDFSLTEIPEFEGFTDNFDGYAVTDYTYGFGSTTTDGVWTLSNVWPGDAYDNHYGGSQVTTESGTDNNLTLTGFGSADAHKVAFNLAPLKYVGISNNVRMNVSMRKTGNSDGGVRFLVSEDEQSYYEFKTGWPGGWWQSIFKVKDGVSEQIASLNMLVDANQWLDIEFYNVEDTIYWTITNTATGVSMSGNYTDPDGLPAKGGNAKYQLWTLNNGGGTEQFDDFSLKNFKFEGYSDNFDGYATTGWNEGHTNTETNGNWLISDTSTGTEGGLSSTAIAGVSVGSDDHVLSLYGMRWGVTHADITVMATLNPANYLGLGDNVSMKVSTMRSGNTDGGIRFMVSSDGDSYYEIKHDWSGG